MGQYRLSIYFKPWQFVVGISYDKGYDVSLYLPFMLIGIGLMKEARGILIFGKDLTPKNND